MNQRRYREMLDVRNLTAHNGTCPQACVKEFIVVLQNGAPHIQAEEPSARQISLGLLESKLSNHSALSVETHRDFQPFDKSSPFQKRLDVKAQILLVPAERFVSPLAA